MRVCVVSFKHCWRDEAGRWQSYGGFPLQMAAVASLFDHMTLAIVEVPPRAGGMALPSTADVVPLPEPPGRGIRRKMALLQRLPVYVPRLVRLFRHADVVHTPVPGDLPLLAIACAVVLRKRLLVRYGSSWETTTETTMMNRVTKTAMRRLAGGRSVMFATGAAAGGPARGIHWLFSTAIARADLERVQPDLDRRPGVPLRLLYVGRLSPEKGVRVLLDALALLQRQHPGAAGRMRLELIGDGPERASLETWARSTGCDALVSFEGQRPHADVVQALSAADVCVVPSLTESYCKARLDAMLCGTPVLTTSVGFGREIVGPDGTRGWVVPPGDAVALSDALRRLLDTEVDWPALRRRCRDYVEPRTLEAWTRAIGERCAAQWNMRLEDGRLRT